MKTVLTKLQAALEKGRQFVARARKAVVAVAGVAAALLAAGLLPEPVATYVAVGLGLLSSWGVWKVPNKPSSRTTGGTIAGGKQADA